MGKDDLIAATVIFRAFFDDATTWRTTVRWDGSLMQEVWPGGDNWGQEWRFTARVPPADLRALVAAINQVGFRRFRDKYEAWYVCDVARQSLAVRFGHEVKVVEAYGPAEIVEAEGDSDMVGFVQLWDLVHRHAPWPQAAEPGIAPDCRPL
jgi:hypothetical protein